MRVKRHRRLVAILLPTLLLVFLLTSPHSSTRLSLILQGHPFARVLPKQQLNIFDFVETDNFACRAIVFSGNKPIGWICLPSTGGFPGFVPFSERPNFSDDVGPWYLWFDSLLIVAWTFRWWLLTIQAVFLLWWLGTRESSNDAARRTA